MDVTRSESVRAVERELLRWCNQRFRNDAPLAVETDLLDGGYLDSLFVMDTVAHIEKRYGITIDSGEISPQHFRSVERLAALVAARRAGG